MASTPLLLSGTSHLSLAQAIASFLEMPLGKILINRFPDKEIGLRISEPIQQRPVFILQSLAFNPNEYLVELLIILDSLKRASAASVNVILPYYAYARQDRINQPGDPLTAKLVADMLVSAGASSVITLDLHSEQIEGFFDIPVTALLSREVLISYCAQLNLKEAIVVAPDNGGIKIASAYAKQLNIPLALIDKERINAFQVEMNIFVGEVKGKTVILPDDMCSTGATLVQAARICDKLGAKRIIALVGHGLFVGNALEIIDNSPIEFVVATDSVPLHESVRLHPKIRLVSIVPLLAKAIQSQIKGHSN